MTGFCILFDIFSSIINLYFLEFLFLFFKNIVLYIHSTFYIFFSRSVFSKTKKMFLKESLIKSPFDSNFRNIFNLFNT